MKKQRNPRPETFCSSGAENQKRNQQRKRRSLTCRPTGPLRFLPASQAADCSLKRAATACAANASQTQKQDWEITDHVRRHLETQAPPTTRGLVARRAPDPAHNEHPTSEAGRKIGRFGTPTPPQHLPSVPISGSVIGGKIEPQDSETRPAASGGQGNERVDTEAHLTISFWHQLASGPQNRKTRKMVSPTTSSESSDSLPKCQSTSRHSPQ